MLAAVAAAGVSSIGVGMKLLLYALPALFLAALAAVLAMRLRRARKESARHFDLPPDMICTVSLDGRFKSVNPAFERALGYRGEELLGRPCTGFIHPEDRERTVAEVAAVSNPESTTRLENR